MNLRSFGALALLAALLASPLAVQASDPRMVVGAIERIDRDGRIRVDGQSILVTAGSELYDQHQRPITRGELAVGVRVEVTYEQGQRGPIATTLIATLLR